jgi:hypothetical protein
LWSTTNLHSEKYLLQKEPTNNIKKKTKKTIKQQNGPKHQHNAQQQTSTLKCICRADRRCSPGSSGGEDITDGRLETEECNLKHFYLNYYFMTNLLKEKTLN